ncbi:MAG: response regulator [Oscillospiraceae bacterium]
MNIIAVDDERIALRLLTTAISEAVPEAKVHSFESAEDALAFGCENPCEIAFLDIDMGSMNGITLAKKLKRINSNINIVFVTAYIKYAAQAVSLYISGYVMKPATKAKIEQEIENLRHPIPMQTKRRIWIQCFGNFEVFADGKPLRFRYSKTKELLAYLIDRGGAYCSNGEIIATLWEDEADSGDRNAYLRKLRADLLSVLNTYDADEALCQSRGFMAIVPSEVDCDYYLWDKGEIRAINAYRGEYMTQYSWSEMTLSGLEIAASKKYFF